MVDLAHILSDSDGETESSSLQSVGEGCTFNELQESQAGCMHVAQVPPMHGLSHMTQSPAIHEEHPPFPIDTVLVHPASEPSASGQDKGGAYNLQQTSEPAETLDSFPGADSDAERPPRLLTGSAYTQLCHAEDTLHAVSAEDHCYPSSSPTKKPIPDPVESIDHASSLPGPATGASISLEPAVSIPRGDVMISPAGDSFVETTMPSMDGVHAFQDDGRKSASSTSHSVAINPREATSGSSEGPPAPPSAYTHPLLEHPPQEPSLEVDCDLEGTHAMRVDGRKLPREDPGTDASLPAGVIQATATMDLDGATPDEAAIPATADLLLLDAAVSDSLAAPLMPAASSNLVDLLSLVVSDTPAPNDAAATEDSDTPCSATLETASYVSLYHPCSTDDAVLAPSPPQALDSTIATSLSSSTDSSSSKSFTDQHGSDDIPDSQICLSTLAEPASASADPPIARSPSPDFSLDGMNTNASLSGPGSTRSDAATGSESMLEEPQSLSAADLPSRLPEDAFVLPTIVVAPPDEDLDSHTHSPPGDENSADIQDERSVQSEPAPLLEDPIEFHPRVQELISSLGSAVESGLQETVLSDNSHAEPLVPVGIVEAEDMPAEGIADPPSPGLPPSSPPCSQVSDLALPSSQDDGLGDISDQPIADTADISVQDGPEADMELCNSQPSSSPPDQTFSSSPPQAVSSPPTSPLLLPEDKGKARAEVAELDLEETRSHVEPEHESKKRSATDDLEEETSTAKRARTTSYSPPLPPNPKRHTMLGQKRAYKKLVQPFRSPLVNIEDVLAGKDHVYATGRARSVSKPPAKDEPEGNTSPARSHDDGETASDALNEPKKLVATRDRTANAGRPFKALVIQPGAATSTLAAKTGSTLQALQARAQKLKQAVKIRDERERGDGQSLEALVHKWRTVGRDVAWLVWDTVKDLDPGDSLKIVPAKGGWGDDEVGPRKKGREEFADGGFKEGWGWDDGKGAGGKQGGFDGSWGWDDKKEEEHEGQADECLEEKMEVDEESPMMDHSLGTMLRHLGIDPETLGWDDDEGDFVGEP
ncbi:hypothetical protein PsYK624_006580 [Phanerochaete sordida]|uniref:Uncharacterized protein n=1 Tax=Phanerochaete sordida TaxID=48140 RepID=A0A9P3L8E0_9APHY|nr:hypothetical protein PsYK624_006580 [Phanerochaete sordida]